MLPLRSAALAALVMSLPLGVPAAMAQDAPSRAHRSTLSISGEGVATAAPDLASFSSGVVSTGKTAREALDANSAAVAQVIGAVKAAGVEDRDVETSNFSVQPQYANQKRENGEAPRIVGYEVRNTVTVRLRDLTKLGTLLDEVVTKGANQIGSIDFGVAEPGKLSEQARVAAVKDARHQAELVAEAAGVRLVRVISLSEAGGFVPAPRMLAAAAPKRAEAVPVEAGETEIRVRVNAVYEIEPR